MPTLPARTYLILCTDLGIKGIHSTTCLEENLRKYSKKLDMIKWKVLKISKKLFEEISKEIDFKGKAIKIFVTNEYYDNLEWDQITTYDRGIKIIKIRNEPYCSLM